mmetsp:Transcript_59709/g.176938  ORF Transcript_59709/g.176938 Transcript_59709/m.176938 type:complete len:1211 (-) Transcript_59709:16-3648(-)
MSSFRQHGANYANGMQLLGASSSGDTDPLYEHEDRHPARYQFYCKDDVEAADEKDSYSGRKSLLYVGGQRNDADESTQLTTGSRSTVLPEHEDMDFRSHDNSDAYAGELRRDHQWTYSRPHNQPNFHRQQHRQEPFYQQEQDREHTSDIQEEVHDCHYQQQQKEWARQKEFEQNSDLQQQDSEMMPVFTFEGSPEPTRSKSTEYCEEDTETADFKAISAEGDKLSWENSEEYHVQKGRNDAVVMRERVAQEVEGSEEGVEVQNIIQIGEMKGGEQKGVEPTSKLPRQMESFRGPMEKGWKDECRNDVGQNDNRIEQVYPRDYHRHDEELPNSAFRQVDRKPCQIPQHEVNGGRAYSSAGSWESSRRTQYPQYGSPRSEWRSESTPRSLVHKPSTEVSLSLSQDGVSLVFEIVETPENLNATNGGGQYDEEKGPRTFGEGEGSETKWMGIENRHPEKARDSVGDYGPQSGLDIDSQSSGKFHHYHIKSPTDECSASQLWANTNGQPSHGQVQYSQVEGTESKLIEQEHRSNQQQRVSHFSSNDNMLKAESLSEQVLGIVTAETKRNADNEFTTESAKSKKSAETIVAAKGVCCEKELDQKPSEIVLAVCGSQCGEAEALQTGLEGKEKVCTSSIGAELATLRAELKESESLLAELQKENFQLRKRDHAEVVSLRRENESNHDDISYRSQLREQDQIEEVASLKENMQYQEHVISSLRNDIVSLNTASTRKEDEYQEKILVISRELAMTKEVLSGVDSQKVLESVQADSSRGDIAREAEEKLQGAVQVITMLENAMVSKNKRVIKLQKKLSGMTPCSDCERSEQSTDSLKHQLAQQGKRCEALEERVKECQEQVVVAKDTEKMCRSQIEKLHNDLKQKMKTTSSSVEGKEATTGKILVERDEYEQMEADIQETLGKYDEVGAKNKELKQTINVLEAKMKQSVDVSTEELARKMEYLENELREASIDKERIARECDIAIRENSELKGVISVLKAGMSDQEDTSSYITKMKEALAISEEENALLRAECTHSRNEKQEIQSRMSESQCKNQNEGHTVHVKSTREVEALNDTHEERQGEVVTKIDGQYRQSEPDEGELPERTSELRNRVSELESKLKNTTSVEERVSELEKENYSLRSEYGRVVDRLESDLSAAARRRKELEKKLSEKAKLLAKAEITMATMNNANLESVMEALSKGRVKSKGTGKRKVATCRSNN